MVIERLRKPEQHLQEAVHIRRCKKVEPASDMADALARIVDDDCEVVAGWYIFTHDYHITPALWLRPDLADSATIEPELGEGKRRIARHFPRQSKCPFHIEAQRVRLAALNPPRPLLLKVGGTTA